MGLRITAKGVVFEHAIAGTISFSNLGAAFDTVVSSSRRLIIGYTGPLLKVRRSLDDTIADIGFNEFGNLDEEQLNTFLEGSDGFVHTLYDQAGGVSYIQEDNARQPVIANAGEIYKINNRVCMNFDGSRILNRNSYKNLVNTSHIMSFSVQSSRATADGRLIFLPDHSTAATLRFSLAQRINTFRAVAQGIKDSTAVASVEYNCPQNKLFCFSSNVNYASKVLTSTLDGQPFGEKTIASTISFGDINAANFSSIGGELTNPGNLSSISKGYKGDIAEIVVIKNDASDKAGELNEMIKSYYSIS